MSHKINNRINNIKLISAIAVVLIHINARFAEAFDARIFDLYLNYITRFSVAFFVIISGYFWMGRYKKETIRSMVFLQFIFVVLVATEQAIFVGIWDNYIQAASIDWYLPAISLMMLVALFFKKEHYIFLFFTMFILENLRIKLGYVIPGQYSDIIVMFFRYGYMFYFGYILKLLMDKPKFVDFISKFKYLFLAIFVGFQLYNSFGTGIHYSQGSVYQFYFVIPLILFALAPNNDRALIFSEYSLDLFLYHILIVSLVSHFNLNVLFVNVTNIKLLFVIVIIELIFTVLVTIGFGKFIRYIDKKYLQMIY